MNRPSAPKKRHTPGMPSVWRKMSLKLRKIHTDFERGFIRAEVVNYGDLLREGSIAAAKEKGLVRLEGKEYIVQDGDVILFRFNV